MDSIWTGRDDSSEGGDTRRLFQIVRLDRDDFSAGDPVLLGFACDAGVKRNHGRPGARKGPTAIRRMLANLPAHTLQAFWDFGDVTCEDDALEAAQAAQGRKVARVLDTGALPVTLGGGHEVAWSSFQGLAAHLAGIQQSPRLLIVNLDAHFDLRTSRPGTSGTSFDQILEYGRKHALDIRYACFGVSPVGNTQGLYDHARSLNVAYVEDSQMQEVHLSARLTELEHMMASADMVYLTIDLDVLPASVAPGVSAPAPFGVPFAVVEAFVLAVKASGKLCMADIAEINPDQDIDNRTARAAARLVWRLLKP
ncbi:MAG: formimidoylglutamase [Castellaniella sp.]|uniref:formimidoylglutamase n=1 Tax=Castellaniella sp. TaxID=1955812 RepID=UPI00120DEA12|nr:formimidoylglutamase [Castellaniella sp.]TAN25111.1 MAG: formimidoylglutamase [Castellaniella sp.]